MLCKSKDINGTDFALLSKITTLEQLKNSA